MLRSVETLKRKGVNIREVVKGKDSVRNGINVVRELFKANRLFIHESCINLIWEYTQAGVACAVVLFAMVLNVTVVILLIVKEKELTATQTIGLSFVNLICGMVISFYFSRTNHVAIGGIGAKATDAQPYVGR